MAEQICHRSTASAAANPERRDRGSLPVAKVPPRAPEGLEREKSRDRQPLQPRQTESDRLQAGQGEFERQSVPPSSQGCECQCGREGCAGQTTRPQPPQYSCGQDHAGAPKKLPTDQQPVKLSGQRVTSSQLEAVVNAERLGLVAFSSVWQAERLPGEKVSAGQILNAWRCQKGSSRRKWIELANKPKGNGPDQH